MWTVNNRSRLYFSTDILAYVIKHVEFMKVKKDHVIVRQGDKGNWYLKTTFVHDQNTTRPTPHPPHKKIIARGLQVNFTKILFHTPKKERSVMHHFLENIGN